MNGRSHLPMREFSIKTGVEATGRAVGGRIRPVDPAAVERFKRIMAEQEQETGRPTAKARKRRPRRPGIDPDLKRKANVHAARRRAQALAEREQKENLGGKQAPETIQDETIEETMMSGEVEVTNEQLMACHKRYMAGVESLRVIAADVNVSWQALQAMFKEADLPKRDGQPFKDFNGGRPKKKKVKAPSVQPTVKSVSSELAQVGATNGETAVVDPAQINSQLDAIQQLMGTIGSVENVKIAGTIRIELTAEVVF